MTLALCFVVAGIAIGGGSHDNESGYYLLGATLVAHVCRVMGTVR